MKKQKSNKKQLLSNYKPGTVEAGCDEAGRGCLAGPVFAAAVILPPDFQHPFLTDSKQLSEKQRDELRKVIELHAISLSVEKTDSNVIDRINILNASISTMHKAIKNLRVTPELLLIDGNRFTPYPSIAHRCIVKGDSKYLSIAAASVLAKTYRDEFMVNLHYEFPQYQWNKNKGYPTVAHRAAINSFGITPYHRRSFKLVSNQMEIPFSDDNL